MKQKLIVSLVCLDENNNETVGTSNSFDVVDNRIPYELVESFIEEVEFTTEVIFGKMNTVMRYKLKNGFVGIESSTCVDEKNYSFEIGCDILKSRLEDKIWSGLGFALGMAN